VVLAIKFAETEITGASGPSPSKSTLFKTMSVPPPLGVNVAVNVVINSSWLTTSGSSSEQAFFLLLI